MRPIFVPITGISDANGNATIPIRLEATGDWRNVKVALETSAPAEWAILKSGIPVNYGRGRRVTLGPELLEPQDTLVAKMIGGPANAAIGPGSCTGIGGTLEEIVPGYQPAPNTIALDVGAPRRLLGTISPGPNATVTQNFVLPSGTLAIAFQANSNPNAPANVTILGHTTGDTYWNATLGPLGILRKRALDPALDPSVDCSVTAVLNFGASVDFWAVMAPEAMYVQNDNQDPLTVQSPPGGNPLSVDVTDRAARLVGAVSVVDNSGRSLFPSNIPKTLNSVIAAAGTVVIIAAVAGQFVLLRGLIAATSGATISLQDTAGTEVGSLAAGANFGTEIPDGFLTLGLGFQMVNLGGVNATINGSVFWKQMA